MCKRRRRGESAEETSDRHVVFLHAESNRADKREQHSAVNEAFFGSLEQAL